MPNYNAKTSPGVITITTNFTVQAKKGQRSGPTTDQPPCSRWGFSLHTWDPVSLSTILQRDRFLLVSDHESQLWFSLFFTQTMSLHCNTHHFEVETKEMEWYWLSDIILAGGIRATALWQWWPMESSGEVLCWWAMAFNEVCLLFCYCVY